MGRAHEVRAASMAKTAAIKSKNNAKHAMAIYLAAKGGVPDPDLNQSLKKAIERAKKDNTPVDVIKRAIEKAKGGTGEASYNFVRYEGFGPNNSLIMVDCLTDNVNRTYTSIKTAFARSGYKLGVSGCVEYQFDNVALFSVEGISEDDIMEMLIMNDCDYTNIETEDGVVTIYASNTEYTKIKDAFEATYPDVNLLEDEVTWLPKAYVELSDPDDIRHHYKLSGMLDENEDVQQVYHNIQNLPEEE